MTDKNRKSKAEEFEDPASFIPFRAGTGHYDPAVAKAFFKSFGQPEKIPAGTTLFVEKEKSKKRSIFKETVAKALNTPVNSDLFASINIHRMYLLTKGEIELTKGGKPLYTVRPGDVFGEIAVIAELPDVDIAARRSATARATADSTGFSLDGVETQKGLAKQPEFALMLMSVMFDRLRFQAARLGARSGEDAHKSKRGEQVFDEVMLTALHDRLDHVPMVRYAKGAKIMTTGHSGTTMYVVMEGQVAVAIGRRIVEKLEPGSIFGEMAVVDQSPRVANAVARSDCVLMSINREALISLVKSDPALGMVMMRSVAGRLRYMNSLLT